ncbi:lactate utilization protein [Tissierella sp.]|uniref:lactate utilization protein n=1 Tax=Tissierella sp. TaxID=41274 RepID=UPI00285E968E|nr:lactate utilization protein [Tissierella sp.]MDR7857018.1 lactate utilization protein [Tissierella sp.]
MDGRFIELESMLKRNSFEVKMFNNIVEAKEELLSQIKLEESVGMGGSITVQEMELYEDLRDRGNDVYWHWKKDIENAINKAKNADTYITSTNAITMDGKLVNMDGNGNRVGAMIYGHKDVYILVGKNKICSDYEAARERIKNIAAPMNAKRLNLNTPCVHTGKCIDCDSPQRICKAEVILHRNPGSTKIHIYLIDEELGY